MCMCQWKYEFKNKINIFHIPYPNELCHWMTFSNIIHIQFLMLSIHYLKARDFKIRLSIHFYACVSGNGLC